MAGELVAIGFVVIKIPVGSHFPLEKASVLSLVTRLLVTVSCVNL